MALSRPTKLSQILPPSLVINFENSRKWKLNFLIGMWSIGKEKQALIEDILIILSVVFSKILICWFLSRHPNSLQIPTGCHIFASVLEFCSIKNPPIKRLNLASIFMFVKLKCFDWRIVNCAKIKNGSKNVTCCIQFEYNW
jgi:hypothetical protein